MRLGRKAWTPLNHNLLSQSIEEGVNLEIPDNRDRFKGRSKTLKCIKCYKLFHPTQPLKIVRGGLYEQWEANRTNVDASWL